MQLKDALKEDKRHYKMYKSGRQWTIAGISLVMAGVVWSQSTPVHAATTSSENETESKTSDQTTGNKVILTTSQTQLTGTPITIGTQTMTAGEQLPTSVPTVKLTNLKAPTAWATSDFDYRQVDSHTAGTYKITFSTAGLAKLAAANPSVTITQANVVAGSLTVTENTQNTKTAMTSTTQTTAVNSSDSTAVATAKQKAAAAYKTTGTPQRVTAKAALTPGTVKVGTTTKTYDQRTDTPQRYTVTLGAGMKAPSSWYVTDTANQYEVTAASGDLDLSAVQQAPGTYAVKLSSQGLQAVQTVNPNFSVTSANVTAGSLVIKPAQPVAGAVAIGSASKDYDNDATTDPTSYQVTLAEGSQLVAPSTWTKNADGTYQVSVASGDLTVQSTASQQPGRYVVSLSALGIANLQAVNPNFEITNTTASTGVYTINSHIQAIIDDASVKVNGALPKTVSVTINYDPSYGHPEDWTIHYINPDVKSVQFDVPIKYFDTSAVDLTKPGNYTLNFTADTMAILNSTANSVRGMSIAPVGVQTGTLTVLTATSNGVKFNPGNMFVTLDGATTVAGQYVPAAGKVYYLSRSSALTMHVAMLNTAANGGTTVNNLTHFMIIPAGFLIGTKDATGNNVIATDPAAAMTSQIEASLAANQIAYSGLKVTQLADYNGRQTFCVTFDQVTQATQTSRNTVDITIIGDPNSTITGGYIGTASTAPDDSVLYRTDDVKYTNGAYTMDLSGYSDVPAVSNALGVTRAVVLNSGYDGFVYAYQFVDAQVQDSYNLTAPDGTVLQTIKTTGKPDTAYDALSLIPQTITKDGVTYQLQNDAVPLTTTYPKLTSTVSTATGAVSTGNTYSVQYVQVLDTAVANGSLSDVSMEWANGSTPTKYTITLPAGLIAPSSWTKVSDNTYTIPYLSGDVVLGDASGKVGTTSISMTAQGLAALAAANPMYRFNNQVIKDGTLTITASSRSIPVSVVDTAGNLLRPEQNIAINFSDDLDATSVSVVPVGYTQAQSDSAIQKAVFTYQPNADGLIRVDTYAVDTATGNVLFTSVTGNGTPNSLTFATTAGMTAGQNLASLLNDNLDIGTTVGNVPTILNDYKAMFANIANVVITYRQQAHLTVNYVDDDTGGALVTSDTSLTGFIGDAGQFTTTLPLNYAYVNAADTSVAYTLSAVDNTLTVHLKHAKLVTPQAVSVTLTTNYTGTQTPVAAQVQTATYTSTLDQVTGATTWTADAPTAVTMNTPEVAGYTPDATTTTFDLSGVLTTQPQAQGKTVNYSANPIQIEVTFTGLPADKTPAPGKIQTATDQPYTYKVPTVAGYTPNVAVMTGNGQPGVNQLMVNYTPDTQTVQINYVDDTDGHDLSKLNETLSGATDTTRDYTVSIPTGYRLATNQEASIQLNFEPNMTPITVHLVHALSTSSLQTTRTITYQMVGGDNTKLPGDEVQTTTWNVVVDPVTGAIQATTSTPYQAVAIQPIDGYTVDPKSVAMGDSSLATQPTSSTVSVTYTAQNADVTVEFTGLPQDKTPDSIKVATTTDTPYTVAVPSVSGYTADTAVVTGTGDGQSHTISVAYTANSQKLNVYYVDDVTGQTLSTTPLDGHTDETGTYQVVVPDRYVLATGQANEVPYQFTVGTDDDITIHLVHRVDHGTYTSTRTIHYQILSGDTTKAPADTVQTLTWKTSTDVVTGASIYTPIGNFAEVAVPELTGYTPETSSVSAVQPVATTTQPDNLAQTVSYAPAAGQATIHFVDQNGKILAPDQTMATQTDVAFTFSEIPVVAGYTPSAQQITGIGDGANNQEFTVTYTANSQYINVNYVDDSTQTALPNLAQTLNGYTAGTQTYRLDVPQGYKYETTDANGCTFTLDDSAQAGTLTFGAAALQTLTIHLSHVLTHGSATSTRTIQYVMNGGNKGKAPSPVIQNANWNTTTDRVTGETSYTAIQGYPEVDSPVVTGYTTQTLSVPAESLGTTTTAPASTIETVIYDPDIAIVTVNVTDPNTRETTPYDIRTKTDEPYDFPDLPELDGYTPSIKPVTGTGDGQPHTIDVTYTANAQTATITYVDDDLDETNQPKVLSDLTTTLSGETQTTVSYLMSTPTGYEVAKDDNVAKVEVENCKYDPATGTFTFGADGTQTVTIHLEHIHQLGTTTSTRTITYVMDGGDVTKAPAPVVQTVNWTTNTDLVTNTTTYTTSEKYGAVGAPEVSGYTALTGTSELPLTAPQSVNETVHYTPNEADVTVNVTQPDGTSTTSKIQTWTDTPYTFDQIPSVAGYTPSMTSISGTGDGQPHTIDVTYTPNAQTATIKYVDAVTGEALDDLTTTLSGVTDQTSDYTLTLPKGYIYDANTATAKKFVVNGNSAQLTFGSTDNQNVLIYLLHDTINTTLTSQRVITYKLVNPNGQPTQTTPASVTQTIQWHVTTDAVTGQSVATAHSGYAAVANPPITGYTTDGTVSDEDLGYPSDKPTLSSSSLSDLAKQISDLNVAQTVTYTPVQKFVYVHYVGLPADKALVHTTQTTTMDVPFTIDVPEVAGYNSVAAVNGVGQANDQTFTVTYTPQTQSVTVQYYDDTDQKLLDGDDIVLTGTTDSKGTVPYNVPAGYVLVSDQQLDFTFEPDAAQITVHIKHGLIGSTLTTQRTISYKLEGGDKTKIPAAVSQTTTWRVFTDMVTGAFKLANTPKPYQRVDSPVIAGYTVDQATVNSGAYLTTTLPQDSTVTVKYEPIAADVTLSYTGLPEAKRPAMTTVSTQTDVSYQIPVPQVLGYSPVTDVVAGNGTGEDGI